LDENLFTSMARSTALEKDGLAITSSDDARILERNDIGFGVPVPFWRGNVGED
jgi:hypothetical protein